VVASLISNVEASEVASERSCSELGEIRAEDARSQLRRVMMMHNL
jgi:hypothetical protein